HYESALSTAHKALAKLVPLASTTPTETFRTAMLSLGNFGIGPAVPIIAVGDTPDICPALAKQSAPLLKVSQQPLRPGTARSRTPGGHRSASSIRATARARARGVRGRPRFAAELHARCDGRRGAQRCARWKRAAAEWRRTRAAPLVHALVACARSARAPWHAL